MTPRQTFWGGVAASIGTVVSLLAIWSFYRSETDRMPIFEKEAVYFNEYASVNDDFMRFIRERDGEKVSINTVFDFSPFSFNNYDVLNKCNNAYPREGQSEEDFLASGGSFDILDGKIFNKPLYIPHHHQWDGEATDDCPSTVEIVLATPRDGAPLTYGGTGVVRMSVRGNFVIHQRISGATETLTLREVDLDEN